mgnify:CR=1
MPEAKIDTHSVLMAGVGGKGVLTAGLLLAEAGASQFPHVLWFPSYQAAKRGGPCECTVILSAEEIASPALSETESLIIMDKSQLRPFLGRLSSGGLLIVDNTGFEAEVSRKDINIIKIPAVEMAVGMRSLQSANLILLGAYVRLKQVLAVNIIEEELREQFSSREQQLKTNLQALYSGWQLAADYVT